MMLAKYFTFNLRKRIEKAKYDAAQRNEMSVSIQVCIGWSEVTPEKSLKILATPYGHALVIALTFDLDWPCVQASSEFQLQN